MRWEPWWPLTWNLGVGAWDPGGHSTPLLSARVKRPTWKCRQLASRCLFLITILSFAHITCWRLILFSFNPSSIFCHCSFRICLFRNLHAQVQKWFTTNLKSSSSVIQISQSSAISTFSTVLPVCQKQMPAMFGWVAWQLWQEIRTQPQRRHWCYWKRDTSRTRKMGNWGSIGTDENSSKNWRSHRKRPRSRLSSQLTVRHRELCSRRRSRSMAISRRLMTPSLQVIGYFDPKGNLPCSTSVLQCDRGWYILFMVDDESPSPAAALSFSVPSSSSLPASSMLLSSPKKRKRPTMDGGGSMSTSTETSRETDLWSRKEVHISFD